jgi:hypothetical protein
LPTYLEYGSPRTKAYDDRSNQTSREDSLDQLEEARDVALLHSAQYQQSLRRYHTRGVRPRGFQVGDLVLRLRQDARGRHKLTPPWEGPFIIAKILKPETEEAKPPRAEHVTAQRLQALLHPRRNQRSKGRTAMKVACNRTAGAHPFDFVASSMEAQAHTSCNRRAGYYVQETAPPLAPMTRLLDCGTGATTRGNPAHDPTVPTEHRPVSCGRRRDDQYGQKWTDSNCSRRAEATVESPAGSRPLLKRRWSSLPWREDDAPVFRSSNGSRTRPPRESPVPPH